jgi:hypothetical protein
LKVTPQLKTNDNFFKVSLLNEENRKKIDLINNEKEPELVSSISEVIYKKGYSPYINSETGTWFEYDDAAGGFIDTNIKASASYDLATSEKEGLMSAADKQKLDNLKDNVKLESLIIGKYSYDGTKRVEIPIYEGSSNSEEVLVASEDTDSNYTMNLVASEDTDSNYTMNLVASEDTDSNYTMNLVASEDKYLMFIVTK